MLFDTWWCTRGDAFFGFLAALCAGLLDGLEGKSSLACADTFGSCDGLCSAGLGACDSLTVVFPSRVSVCCLIGDSVLPLLETALTLTWLGLGLVDALLGFRVTAAWPWRDSGAMLWPGFEPAAPAGACLVASPVGAPCLLVPWFVGRELACAGGVVGVLAAIGRLAVGVAPELCAAGLGGEECRGSDRLGAPAGWSPLPTVCPAGLPVLGLSLSLSSAITSRSRGGHSPHHETRIAVVGEPGGFRQRGS